MSDAERLAEARDALRQCWVLSGADTTNEPTDIARAAIQGVQDLRDDYDDPAEAVRVAKLEGDYATLLAEHEALLRRVADAELADIRNDGKNGGESALLSAAMRAGYYSGVPVRILAEPGEVDP